MEEYRNQRDRLLNIPITNPIFINNVRLQQVYLGMYKKKLISHRQVVTPSTPKTTCENIQLEE